MRINFNRLLLTIRNLLEKEGTMSFTWSTKSNLCWAVMLLGLLGCAPAEPIQAVTTSQNDASMSEFDTQNDQSLSPAISDAGSPFRDGMTPNLDAGLSTTMQDSQLVTDAENDSAMNAEVGMTAESSEALPNQAATIAAELDVLCEADCQKDLACNPAEAEPIDACVASFCGYVMNLDTEAVNANLVRCFESERDLLACITTLSCENYIQYYYGDETSVIPCADSETAYESACAEFFGEEVD